MAIRLFSDPVQVLSIGRNPIQVLSIRSDPVQVLSIRSDPIRPGPGFVNTHALFLNKKNLRCTSPKYSLSLLCCLLRTVRVTIAGVLLQTEELCYIRLLITEDAAISGEKS